MIHFNNTFDPRNISNLFVWLDPTWGIKKSGSNLISWKNKSNNGFNFSSTVSPLYIENQLNGLPAIYMDNKNLQSDSATTFDDFSLIITFKDVGTTAAYERLLDHLYTAGFWMGRNATTANSFGGGVKEAGAPYGIFATCPDNTVNTIYNIREGTNHSMYNNNVLFDSNTIAGTTTSNNKIGVGCWYDSRTSQRAREIYFYNILIYKKALNADEMSAIQNYLNNRFSL